MKMSNLALRQDTGEPDRNEPAEQAPSCREVPADARRLARTRRLGLDYRAIEIRDDGLRPLRIR